MCGHWAGRPYTPGAGSEPSASQLASGQYSSQPISPAPRMASPTSSPVP
jgi:hypothetical protein